VGWNVAEHEIDPIERAAGAVTDGTPIDWRREMGARPDLSGELEGLRLLSRVRTVFATGESESATQTQTQTETVRGDGTAAREEPLFHWGHLEVLERIGGGGGGDVYRAYDPTLDTDVALKLRKESDPWPESTTNRFRKEARRLARVRHDNVVRVFGADQHDGRFGIWTEFVNGKSLEEMVRDSGPLGAREAASIGLDLCRALAAVHRAGFIHRDVKPANVMHEEGGRIVLMDFGSIAEVKLAGAPPSSGEVQGTPLFMAPEQIRGQIAGPATDIYGLGVLLYYLVSRHYPIEAGNRRELEDRHRQLDRVPLRDRRADLPLDFITVVERCLSPDPLDRFQSAGNLEQALLQTLGVTPPIRPVVSPPPVTVFLRYGALAAAMAVIVVTVILAIRPKSVSDLSDSAQVVDSRETPKGSSESVGAAHLDPTATLLRRRSGADHVLAGEAQIEPGDLLAMRVRGTEPMNVYVLNEDQVGNLYVLFPLPGGDLQNPLRPNVDHRLPGSAGGSDSLLSWVVTNPGVRETIVVMAAREPLDSLEQVIALMPPASPDRPIEYQPISPEVLENLRGIGGLKTEGTITDDALSQFHQIVDAISKRAKREGDIWIRSFDLRNPPATP